MSVELKKDDIVTVEWQDGRYAGKRQPAVQARNIIEPNLEEVRAGTKLKIKMGKSASAKVWNAVFVSRAVDKTEEEEISETVTNAEPVVKKIKGKRNAQVN